MFAVARIAGKQYGINPNDTIAVDRIDGEPGTTVEFTDVLLVEDGKTVKIGTPTVKGYTVKAKILEQKKDAKINVRRFKSKVRYRKSIGFRAQLTSLEILSIAKA